MTVQPYRCPDCGKLLFKSDAEAGRVETFCRTCKTLVKLEVRPNAARLTRRPTRS